MTLSRWVSMIIGPSRVIHPRIHSSNALTVNDFRRLTKDEYTHWKFTVVIDIQKNHRVFVFRHESIWMASQPTAQWVSPDSFVERQADDCSTLFRSIRSIFHLYATGIERWPYIKCWARFERACPQKTTTNYLNPPKVHSIHLSDGGRRFLNEQFWFSSGCFVHMRRDFLGLTDRTYNQTKDSSPSSSFLLRSLIIEVWLHFVTIAILF